jgi:hypothetical protein
MTDCDGLTEAEAVVSATHRYDGSAAGHIASMECPCRPWLSRAHIYGGPYYINHTAPADRTGAMLYRHPQEER